MSRQERTKWVDPRTPVSVTQVGKWKVTIYDQAAYDASLKQYSDEDKKPQTAKVDNTKPQFKKGKSTNRYRWARKLETPLSLTLPATGKGESA